jgi:hypothetical protein
MTESPGFAGSGSLGRSYVCEKTQPIFGNNLILYGDGETAPFPFAFSLADFFPAVGIILVQPSLDMHMTSVFTPQLSILPSRL